MRARRFAAQTLLATLLFTGGVGGNGGLFPEFLVHTANAAPAGTAEYKLTPEEQKLDCKKLTGRMQVRILQIRDYETREKTSSVSRALQTAATPIFGGTTVGADPDQRYRRDRAVLEAYNRQLAAKKCKTFDLESELRAKPSSATPTPVSPKKAN